MIEQVVMNLAVNARDAMPRGGQLTITSCSEVIGKGHARNNPEARTGQFACLVVADTGCGMDMETLNRVFEPFFTTKDVGKGTGLGLATVYGIVKQHDGWVEVTSTPRKGTTFKVYLPTLAVAAEAEKKDARPVSVKGGQERLLLVEDEPALRKLASRVLQAYGYEVLAAADGLEALDEWSRQKGRIDLLVTDVVMPNGMSGKDLADRIRAHSPDLKVLYTSGYAFELSGLDLRQQSGCKFLPKPYLPSALAQAVRDCLSDELQEVRSEAELA
jgi:CheY-like chemotaxis protein